MLCLVLHVLVAALFSTCYKIADSKEGYRTSAVLFFMYMGAAGFCIPMALCYEGFVADGRLIAYGLVAGIVFYPTKGVCGVIFTALLAVLIWKEKLTKRQAIGISLGALSVLLVNIK